MFCTNCGAEQLENVKYCSSCGNSLPASEDAGLNLALIGFSSKIDDPTLKKYVENNNRWSLIFAAIIAVIAIVGFFIYGESSSEMDNPQALFIGLGIGGMFLLIALIQVISRSRDRTWDGRVIDKKVENKRRKQNTTDNDYYWVDYMEYAVVIERDDGKRFTIKAEDDDTQYNYYQVGDRVRHHQGLNSYEKYDKSRDTIIFCNACANLNDIRDDYCFRCHCVLLK